MKVIEQSGPPRPSLMPGGISLRPRQCMALFDRKNVGSQQFVDAVASLIPQEKGFVFDNAHTSIAPRRRRWSRRIGVGADRSRYLHYSAC